MIKLSVKHNVAEVVRYYETVPAKQVRFATMKSLNQVGKQAGVEVEKAIERTFDRPTRYAIKSTYVKFATRERLRVEIGLKDHSSTDKRGTPAVNFLGPHVYGQARGLKRFESALRHFGIMRPNEYAVIAKGFPTDAYGNLSKGIIQRMLSGLKAAERFAGVTANVSQSTRSRRNQAKFGEFFVSRGKSTGSPLPRGVYQAIRTGYGKVIRAVVIFVVGKPKYRRRLDFFEIVERVTQREFRRAFEVELRAALATSRP